MLDIPSTYQVLAQCLVPPIPHTVSNKMYVGAKSEKKHFSDIFQTFFFGCHCYYRVIQMQQEHCGFYFL